PQPARPGPGRLPLAYAGADRRGPLLALAGERHDPLQGGGVGVDARGRSAAAGLGRPFRAEPRLCPAWHARPLSAPPGASAVRLPIRPPGERTGDPRLRGDRHAADDHLPQLDFLAPPRPTWRARPLRLSEGEGCRDGAHGGNRLFPPCERAERAVTSRGSARTGSAAGLRNPRRSSRASSRAPRPPPGPSRHPPPPPPPPAPPRPRPRP